MNRLQKKLSYIISTMIMLNTMSTSIFIAEAKEQSLDIAGQMYEFGKKSEYEIDSADSSDISKNISLGTLSISGDIRKTYDKEGVAAYEIADNGTFSLDFNYIDSLKNADKDEWHLIEDNKDVVNGSDLGDDIDYGALILQTSFDGSNWVDCKSYVNINDDKNFGDEQINNIQLANGCYYRIIAAYEIEKRIKDNKVIDDYENKKIAQVYTFYASYKDIDNTPTGEKFYFYAGAKNAAYTVKTKKNNYTGSETISKDDPHYGWDLGYFCLSGYTDKGDSDDVYLKKVGNKVKLTFHLDQDIKKLNGNSDFKIKSDKNGSDEEFKVPSHNMKHGELIIRHTDSENVTKEVKYSDYLAALASPGADTAIQLFEEGDYEVHLNYAITDKKGINSTTYYQTSFNFKIRNANCMVYIFDALTGSELSNGDVTVNGFRIDTAKSSYPKLHVKKEILNSTKNGLVEEPRFNSAASDGETFTSEGIYTIKAYNRYDDKLEPAVKTIYIGSNNILTAYTKHLNSSEQYTIAQLNNLIDEGYTITGSGDIIEPVYETTVDTSPVITTVVSQTTAENNETSADSEAITSLAVDREIPEKSDKKSPVPFVAGGTGLAAIIGFTVYFIKRRKK